ncbi:PC3-like endoprotease variant B [Megalops cyprinoides]|uniref:PC3-like endoprotease variant B n=1 Tax=Megalops cyprinoides TaxID=118141 RepID=UPI0018652C8F|nr:PC3-like endoprotease variant B [Megalops cyprinoides]
MKVLLVTVCYMLQWQLAATGEQRDAEVQVFYAVEMEGGTTAARALAEKHGLQFISRVGNLESIYTLRAFKGQADRHNLESQLSVRTGVKWVQRQQAQYRDKRASIRELDRRIHQEMLAPWHGNPSDIKDVLDTERGESELLHFNDPLWPLQWELLNRGQFSSPKGFDLNVMSVWRRNITGRGVVVTIVDDGIDHTNLDLKKNFEAFASFDLRGAHGLSHDPMPLRDEDNGHGTRCAGEVAMEANNSYCGVGIAFNARIGGIRLLDGAVTDSMEATSLTYNNDFIDIYTCCWGPKDNGMEMAGPGRLAQKALRLGTQKGRGGKGNIFVWASGNGGMVGDHCGADGYVNSIYSIAIGAVTHTGLPAFFGEPCPAVMAVTPTGAGNGENLPLVTVSNLDEGCVTHFSGTSSAAPIAAGVLALVLEANPDLTWRDVQHLIAKTAKIPNPVEPGWSINGAGYHIHDRYGFGLLDAGLMVQQAIGFQSMPPQRKCSQEMTFDPARILPPGGVVSVHIQSDGCRGTDNAINTLEHVQVTVSITSVCRGDLSVDLISPYATRSQLLGTRHNDVSTAGLKSWTLMTVQSWGEDPHGTWRLKVTDNKDTVARCRRGELEEAAGAVLSVTLTLYGTFDPQRPDKEPLQRIVSMGKTHPVPLSRNSQRNDVSVQELIQKEFEMESRHRVTAEDIPIPLQIKNTKLKFHSTPSFSSQDMDDTNGVGFRAHLESLWNTLRDRVESNWLLYKSMTKNQSPQLRWTDTALQRFLGAGQTVGGASGAEIREMRELSSDAGGQSEPPAKMRTQVLGSVATDIREMRQLRDTLRASGGQRVRRGRLAGREERRA